MIELIAVSMLSHCINVVFGSLGVFKTKWLKIAIHFN